MLSVDQSIEIFPISVFVIKLACANLTLKKLVAKVVISEVSIYLSWLGLVSLFSISVI